MNEEKQTFRTNDKDYAPFLLCCSYNGIIKYIAEHISGDLVIWEFSPSARAKELINKYELKIPLGLPKKDLSDAKDFFWRRVHEIRTD